MKIKKGREGSVKKKTEKQRGISKEVTEERQKREEGAWLRRGLEEEEQEEEEKEAVTMKCEYCCTLR